jgi:hypothetical protein
MGSLTPAVAVAGALAGAAAGLIYVLPVAGAQADSFATDDRGFVDTEARCDAPAVAVAFGRTERSLVAICAEDGEYEYRGVRLRDDAELVTSAQRSDGAGFIAENDGVTYLVTASSLVISIGERVVREEPMVQFEGQGAPESTPSTTLPPPLPAEEGAAATP